MQTLTRYTFTIRDLTAAWIVRKVDLRESLSQPYALTLELLTCDLTQDPAALLGADCRLTLAHVPGPARDVHGLILRVELLDHDDHLRHLRLEIGPALALFAHRVDTRLWQHTSVPEIIKDVLEDSLTAHGRRLRLDLAASYPARETCTQYRESDLEFVQRLLHEEGISFAFDHDDDSEILVLVDDNARCPVVADLPLVPRGAHIAAGESVERLDPARALGVTSLVQRDWSPLAAADAPFEHSRLAHDDRGRDRLVFDHDDTRTDLDDGNVRARRKLEQRTLTNTAATGLSTALALAPGRRFDLTGHPDPGRDGRWQILEISHRGEVPDADRLADHTPTAPTYINTFTCIPDTTKLRPPLTSSLRRPRIHGPHTAIVVGPEGEEIHTDEHGRIRVRFHWDRSDRRGDDCSCWVRVAQSWAGPGWGALFLPRIGMEVVVQFLDGDPDRPLVVGCVYNSLNHPPVPLPEQKTRSALTSESTPGGGLANQIQFEDARGHESLIIHTRRDLHTRAGHDHTANIHHDQTTNIGANQITTVQSNCTLKVATGNLNTRVDVGNRSTTINGNDTTMVVLGDTQHNTCLGSLTVSASNCVTIDSLAEDIKLTAKKSIAITASENELTLKSSAKAEMRSEDSELKLDAETDLYLRTSKGNINADANTDLFLSAIEGSALLSGGKNTTVRATESMSLMADEIRIIGSKVIRLSCGNSAIEISPESITVSAPMITSTAVGHYVVQGAMIRLN